MAALVLVSLWRRLGQRRLCEATAAVVDCASGVGRARSPAPCRVSPFFLYLLVDLRPWWTTAIVIACFLETLLFGLQVRSTVAASGILFVGVAAWAIATTPQLRFDEALHGTSRVPALLRELVSRQRSRSRQRADNGGTGPGVFSAALAQRRALLVRAVREDTTNAIADARLFFSRRLRCSL